MTQLIQEIGISEQEAYDTLKELSKYFALIGGNAELTGNALRSLSNSLLRPETEDTPVPQNEKPISNFLEQNFENRIIPNFIEICEEE